MREKADGPEQRELPAGVPVMKGSETEDPAALAPASPDPAVKELPVSAGSALSAALKGFMATLHKQSERNTDIIEIFARALKELNREVKDERTRREMAERRLRDAEARLDRIEQMMDSLARQSWIH